jgi:UDP-galactopyranose mutase
MKWEQELFRKADLVFTGGHSLFEAKRHLHSNIFPFPSSIDTSHFRKARSSKNDPEDQATIPHPRIGYYGVIDERLDISLLKEVAESNPQWNFIMVGPVVKIDSADLPQCSNIRYLGQKSYEMLPHYLSGWNIAMMPFAHNQSTRYISPTKTLEYLAGGVPVISTSVRDVVRPYGDLGLVKIADNAQAFETAAHYLMSTEFNRNAWLRQVDETISYHSWDSTWSRMMQLLNLVLRSHYSKNATLEPAVKVQAHATGSTVAGTTGD